MGTRITKALALQHPDVVMAIHLTDVDYPTGQEDPSTLSEAEQEFARFIQGWWFSEGAFAMLQSTKPQSLSFALSDSRTEAMRAARPGAFAGFARDYAPLFA
jgi:hypothetical protein